MKIVYLADGDGLDPVLEKSVDLVQDLHAVTQLGLGLEHVVLLERLLELLGQFLVLERGKLE